MRIRCCIRFFLIPLAAVCFLVLPCGNVLAVNWVEFQGSPEHNGVIDVETMTKADDTVLYWATKVQPELGWASAPSHPMLIDDVIVFFAKKTIYKLDRYTGKILDQGTLAAASSWNITMPTYCDGTIFVSLAHGRIQAVDYETLESKWVYQNDKRGQCNCPVTCFGGRVYSGYWNGPKQNAEFVCVDAETGDEIWTLAHRGGFYWTGCYVCADYLLVGSDDGEGIAGSIIDAPSPTAVLYSVHPLTGEVIDTIDNINGDIRSTVMMKDGVAYFTSEGGFFYGVPVHADGTFDHEHILEIDLGNVSVSTPTVYKDRAYVGVMGNEGHFEKYGGHFIAVLDLNGKAIAYKCPTAGFNQTSAVLTTAYEERDGYVYVYFVENYTPGKIRVIKDKPGQTAMEASGPWADILFTPVGLQEEYALCGPLVDEYGTFYLKNDSGYIMALGWRIEKIEITKMPDKTTYEAGEVFDPAGMEVTATLANGKTKDVTDYVEYGTEPLEKDDIDVTVSYSVMMYGDQDDGDDTNDENRFNQAVPPEYAAVPIHVKAKTEPAPVKNPFADVQPEAYYFDAVLWAVDNGITKGTGAASFSPGNGCTRGQVVTFLWRAAGEPAPSSAVSPFRDVKPGAYYDKAVLWAAEKGIAKGTSAETFSPDDVCTRGQVVTFQWRAAGEPAPSSVDNPFRDVKAGAYYDKAVLWAVAAGITKGTGAASFSPDDRCTRGQIVTFLWRAR